MSSIVPGFEYDIFISYRHKDNKGEHWVTEFVNALKTELEATFKEDISIYFDENPHDGLLETHDVDDSLKEKLKCLIFIPIISQTYCDTKSFAWNHEFLAFKKLTAEDNCGLKIKLANGNVASRILPIKIHELDSDDKTLIESEVGPLRSVDFIFKSAGVNRPLTQRDNREENGNRTVYKDQVNKVANAIKEIINAIKKPTQEAGTTKIGQPAIKSALNRKPIFISIAFLFVIVAGYFLYSQLINNDRQPLIDKSIAILSFVDMSAEKDQEYLGDGIAEEIINALSKLEDIKVIGRTSSFQFKGEKIDLREIGDKLQVATVLQGSVMRSGSKIRISAQLINVDDGSTIWSERYDREIQDVFFIQDEIAKKITQKLALSILKEGYKPQPVPTSNMEAYEMTMKGNYFLMQGPTGALKAREYYQKAIDLDSNYTDAQLGYTGTYIFIGSKEGMLKSINKLKSFNVDPVVMTDLMLTYYMWREGNWKKSKQLYDSSMAVGITPDISHAYYEAAIEKNISKAIRTLEKIIERDPLFLDGLRNLTVFYMYGKEYRKAIEAIDKMIEINADYFPSYRLKAEVYLREGKFSQALDECSRGEARFKDRKMFLNVRIKLLTEAGELAEARKLFYDLKADEDPRLGWLYFSLGMNDKAIDWLNQVVTKNPPVVITMLIDPFYDPYRNDPRFKQAISKLDLPTITQ